jgi:hypothetical protein
MRQARLRSVTLCLMVLQATSSLPEHLAAQNAPRAAARIAAAFGAPAVTAPVPRAAAKTLPLFTVPDEAIRLVDSSSSAEAFIEAIDTLTSPTISLDLEWRPDTNRTPQRPGGGHTPQRPGGGHTPSLLQLATADTVWLVDLEARTLLERVGMDPPPLLQALSRVLSSDRVRVLGFGLQTDLDKLRLLYTPHRGYEDGYTLVARRVVDLREAAGRDGGLSASLARHARCTLDKTCQCSDWRHRPLSTSQVRAARLHPLSTPPALDPSDSTRPARPGHTTVQPAEARAC